MADIAVDASVAVKWFLDEDRSAAARSLLDSPTTLVAPSLIILEVMHALSVASRVGRLGHAALEPSQRALTGLFREAVEIAPLFPAAAALMRQCNLAIYDCLYLALAARERLVLVTADEGQYAAGRRARIAVRLL